MSFRFIQMIYLKAAKRVDARCFHHTHKKKKVKGRGRRIRSSHGSLDYIERLSQKLREDSQVTVAHACNPSYSGGRSQEDSSSKPAPGK
jgi:hypothetical protein